MVKMMILVLVLCIMPIMAICSYYSAKCNEGRFDEMQEIIRGRGYKYSYSMVISFLTAHVIYSYFVPDFFVRFSAEFLAAVAVALGVIVFGVYSIFHDAFFYFDKGKPKSKLLINIVLVALYLLLLPAMIKKGKPLIQDGILILRDYCLFIIVVVVFVVHAIAMLIKRCIDKKQEI